MAALGNLDRNVQANNNPAGGGGSVTVLPDDVYHLEFTELNVVANSKGTGQNMNGKVQVLDGPFKGTWFFSGINNVQHESAQAQAIAQGTLRTACMAMEYDFERLNDTDELLHRPFHARVGTDSYYSTKHSKTMQKNIITRYMYDGMPEDEATEVPATKPAAKPALEPTKPAAGTGAKSMPWKKG